MKVYIEKFRKEKNLTQEQLARLVDMSSSQIRNLEKGRSINCSVEAAIKIKRALGVNNIEDLFNIDED